MLKILSYVPKKKILQELLLFCFHPKKSDSEIYNLLVEAWQRRQIGDIIRRGFVSDAQRIVRNTTCQ